MKKIKKVHQESIIFIRAIEKASNKTPREIYDAFDWSRQYYSILKCGKSPITIRALEKIAPHVKKLGITRDIYQKICKESLTSLITSISI